MPPKVALIACIIFIAWLLKVAHKRQPDVSTALWIPTIWLMIMGSRPVGKWFESGAIIASAGGGAQTGSPLDRLILSALVLLAFLVLIKRHINWSSILKDNRWLIVLYLFLGISVLWSDAPSISFKRWFKISGAVVMAFVILSEYNPLNAIESILRRCAYVLVPTSLLLIKYFPIYGIAYTPHEGYRMGTGVTTHKNSLGILCAITAFFLICVLINRWRAGQLFTNKSQAIADISIIGLSLFLLFGGGASYSATSILIFFVGVAFMLIMTRMKRISRYITRRAKTLTIAGVVFFLLFNTLLMPMATSFLGRNETLSGRAEIWSSILEVASANPLLGTGYGGYWGVTKDAFNIHHQVMQSHNGYLDIYLQVGVVGLLFLFVFIMEFGGKLNREFQHSSLWNIFGTCFLIMLLLYNYTEASMAETNYMWTTMIFLTVVFSVPHLYSKKE